MPVAINLNAILLILQHCPPCPLPTSVLAYPLRYCTLTSMPIYDDSFNLNQFHFCCMHLSVPSISTHCNETLPPSRKAVIFLQTLISHLRNGCFAPCTLPIGSHVCHSLFLHCGGFTTRSSNQSFKGSYILIGMKAYFCCAYLVCACFTFIQM